MKIKWAIESDVFDNDWLLKKACENNGYESFFFSGNNEFDNHTIFYGSLFTAFKMKKTPCQVWIDNFSCSSYYPLIERDALLNNRYVLIPYGELLRMKDEIFGMFAAEQLFIRPNSGKKEFTGYVVSRHDWESEVKSLVMFHDELIFISGVKDIEDEWRLVITDKVVTGSQYIKSKEMVDSGPVPENIVNFANSILPEMIQAAKYPAFTADFTVNKYNDQPKLLELNSFSCAGLYGSDMDLVVKEVSKSLIEYL